MSNATEKLKNGIAKGEEAFSNWRELLRGKVNGTLKIWLIKTLIWSVMLYGSETWTMRKEDIKRLEMWRRMKYFSWAENKTNKEVLETIGEEISLMRTIKTR